jgi:hypothetical protein
MLAHVLLFRVRDEVPADERKALVDAWTKALRDIPSIRRAHVGKRVRIGREYEQLMRNDYPYAAVIEFENEAGLRAYLDHPAHADMANRFFAVVTDALIYDFEMQPSPESWLDSAAT